MWPVKNSSALIGGKFIFQKNPLQDLHSSLNAVISTNEKHWVITDHVTFKLRYNQIYQLKTTIIINYPMKTKEAKSSKVNS